MRNIELLSLGRERPELPPYGFRLLYVPNRKGKKKKVSDAWENASLGMAVCTKIMTKELERNSMGKGCFWNASKQHGGSEWQETEVGSGCRN